MHFPDNFPQLMPSEIQKENLTLISELSLFNKSILK